MEHTKQGCSAVYEKELEPFYKTNSKDELTMQDGCLMWGSRVLFPPKHQTQVLDGLDDGHLGKAKMKAISRSYVWWPGIDKAIEQGSKGCTGCQLTQNNPKYCTAPLTGCLARHWHRIHVDFEGPFFGTMSLIVEDAHLNGLLLYRWSRQTPSSTEHS